MSAARLACLFAFARRGAAAFMCACCACRAILNSACVTCFVRQEWLAESLGHLFFRFSCQFRPEGAQIALLVHVLEFSSITMLKIRRNVLWVDELHPLRRAQPPYAPRRPQRAPLLPHYC